MKHAIWAVIALAFVACSGGGGGTGGSNPVPLPTAQTYTVQLHWVPAASVGLAALLDRPAYHSFSNGSGQTIVVGSGSDPNYLTGWPAYVTVSVSPQPSPGANVTTDTTSSAVTIAATPSPAAPQPNASPAFLVEAKSLHATEKGQTLTASYGGASATDNIVVLQTLAIAIGNVAWSSQQPAYTFDANCNAVGQASSSGADVYLSGPLSGTNEAQNTLHFPYGGIAEVNGYDPTNLTASSWQNLQTSVGLNDYANAADDTIIFKTSTGRIVFFATDRDTPGNGTGDAELVTKYGCLN